MFALHEHTGEEEHGKTFSASCCSKVCSSFSVSNWLLVLFDVFEEFGCGEVLRVSADDFEVFVCGVREVDKVFDDGKQAVFSE